MNYSRLSFAASVAVFLAASASSAAALAFPPPRPPVPIPALAPLRADAPSLLLVGGLSSPALGVDARAPRLSWAAPPTIAAQAAFSINVSEAATGAPAWRTRVTSGLQAVAYAGALLRPATTYVWTVALEGADGTLTAPSAPATFITGLHGATAATPVWVPGSSNGGDGGSGSGSDGGIANQSASFVFLRYTAALPAGQGAIVSAVAFITTMPQAYFGPVEADNSKLLGGYKLFVNGALSGVGPGKASRCGPLCPVQRRGAQGTCTCAPEHLYDSRDVADAVARNLTHVTLALACFNYPPSTAPLLPADSRALLQVFITFASGVVAMFGTDSMWRAFDATAYMGPSGDFGDKSWYDSPQENFDARLEPVGWQAPGFDDGAWPSAAPVAAFPAPLVARPALALTITDDAAIVTPPLAVLQYDNSTFVDFGTDFDGGVCIDVAAGIDGAQLDMRIGEESTVAADNTTRVVRPMRTSNVYAQVWTLRAGSQTICMHEWAQFRYASLTARAGGAAPSAMGLTVRSWVVYYAATYVPLSAFEFESAGDGNATADVLAAIFRLSYYTRFAQSFDMVRCKRRRALPARARQAAGQGDAVPRSLPRNCG